MRIWDALLNAMRTFHRRRIGPREAERLLSRAANSAYPELDHLLAAATAPPRADELAGFHAAVAEFERAARMPAPAAPSRVRTRGLGWAFGVKVFAGTAILLLGGTALAAETGNLPGIAQQHAHDLFAPLGVPAPQRSGAGPTATEPAGGTGTPTPAPSHPGVGRTLSPSSPEALGLCRAWEAARKNADGRQMTAEAFQDLARVAGGEQRIQGFCAPLLAEQGGTGTQPPTPAPSQPGNGNGNTDGAGNGNGNGPPTSRPNQKG
nr:hypothetical protein [Micromonospora sp. DSM 115978]